MDEARLLDRPGAGGEGQVGPEAVGLGVDEHPQQPQGLDDLDRDGTDGGGAVARATGRGVHGHLLAVDDHAERAVDHLAVRVEPERHAEDERAVGGGAVEEVAVVVVGVGRRRSGERLGGLVDRVVVAGDEHRRSLGARPDRRRAPAGGWPAAGSRAGPTTTLDGHGPADGGGARRGRAPPLAAPPGDLPPLDPAGRAGPRRDHRHRRARAPHRLRSGLPGLAGVQPEQLRRRLEHPRRDRAGEPPLHGHRRDRGHPGRARRPRPRAAEAGPDVAVARPRRRRHRSDRARRHHGPDRPAPRRRPVPLRPVDPDPHRRRRPPPPRLRGARSLPADRPRTDPPAGAGGLGPGRAGHRHGHGRDRQRTPRWRREGPPVRVRGDVRGAASTASRSS